MKKMRLIISVPVLVALLCAFTLTALTGCDSGSDSPKNDSKAPTATAVPTGHITATEPPTAAVTPTEAATPTAAPTDSVTPTVTPVVSDRIDYGDLTQYLGMKASTLIEKIGCDYEYVYRGDSSLYETSGSIHFDDFAEFLYPDCTETFDTSLETMIVRVKPNKNREIKMSIGNGLDTFMTYSQLRTALGSAIIGEPEYSSEYGAYIFSCGKGGYRYVFRWMQTAPGADERPTAIEISESGLNWVFEDMLASRMARFREGFTDSLQEHRDNMLNSLRDAYESAPVASCSFLAYIRFDDLTLVTVYEAGVYGRPLTIDEKTFKCGLPDPTVECFQYALVAQYTDKNGKIVESVYPITTMITGDDTQRTHVTFSTVTPDTPLDDWPNPDIRELCKIDNGSKGPNERILVAHIYRDSENDSYRYGNVSYFTEYGQPILDKTYIELTTNSGGYSQMDCTFADKTMLGENGYPVVDKGKTKNNDCSISWEKQQVSDFTYSISLSGSVTTSDTQYDYIYLVYKGCVIVVYSEFYY
ncbi:MAG: hypothetical protein IKX54_02065 [Lachnospiraceae bacterium]|nr:hypothetical protein [Lachnospiraceae bacterium]